MLPSRDTIVAGAASRICRRKPLSADVNETVRAVSSCSNSVRSRITKREHGLRADKHPALRSPADLAGHNCLRFAHAPAGNEWWFRDARGNPVAAHVSGNLITTSTEMMRAAAIAGIGLLLFPPFLISRSACLGSVGAAVAGLRNTRD